MLTLASQQLDHEMTLEVLTGTLTVSPVVWTGTMSNGDVDFMLDLD